MLKTSDGGKSWQELYNNADGDDLVFTNDSTGYLCANNFVYKTVNGGNSFYKVSTGLSDLLYLNKIFFVHPEIAFLIFQPVTNLNVENIFRPKSLLRKTLQESEMILFAKGQPFC